MRRHLLLAALLSPLFAACGEGEVRTSAILTTDAIPVPGEVLRASGRNGLRPFGSTPTVLYVNFDGATITKISGSDASKNGSFIGGGTIPAFSGDAAMRAQIVTLIKQLYSAYNIQIVTSRPASGDYDMALVGGTPAHLGLNYPSGVVGVAPMDCGNQMPRDIAFIFAQSLESIVGGSMLAQRTAETAAHESAHSYGLPHSGDGCDLMSYSQCAQLKTFLDKQMSMQSDSYGTCSMTSMNSYQLLMAELGPASTTPDPTDSEAPKVTISSPQSGTTLGTSLVVRATVTDNVGVTKAEMLVDNIFSTSRTGGPYEFNLTLGGGQHTLTVNGYDAAGNKGTSTVSVTVDGGTTTPPGDTEAPKVTITTPAGGAKLGPTFALKAAITDNTGVTKAEAAVDGNVVAMVSSAPYDFTVSLAAGQHTLVVNGYDAAGNKGSASVLVTVEAGTTAPPVPVTPSTPTPGSFGATCVTSADCSSKLCGQDTETSTKFCTAACDPNGDPCPGGASCYPTNSTQHVCGTPVSPSLQADPDGRLVGGCAVAGADSDSLLLVLLGLFGLFVLRRRS
jgi:MYXO-CTERM domain-containing protein